MAPRKKAAKSTKSAGSSTGDPAEETPREMKPVKRWLEEIQQAKDAAKPYNRMVDEIVKRYRDEEADSQKPEHMRSRKYNVMWSIMQTMQPLVYSEPPKPHITRRHSDRDTVARDATLLLSRNINYSLEGDELHDALIDARDDYLLGSRGVVWAKYTPYLKLRESEERTYIDDKKDAPKDVELKEDEKLGIYYHNKYEEKVYEEIDWEHVGHNYFLHGSASKWKHVPWVARMVPMTREELIERFGEEMGEKPPLTINNKNPSSTSMGSDDEDDSEGGMFARAEVWEIWHRKKRKVYWLCPGYADSFLDEVEDPLELEGFFPCPRPAFGTKTNNKLTPVPDYKMWQDIANELDDVTWRIKLLVESLRVVGIYDKQLGDLVERLTSDTTDNDMIGVDSYAMMAERGGLKGSIEYFPIENVAAVLDKLYMARERLVNELYDITGISDIIRGASDPRETATAQQVKGQFANKRLSTRQREMSRMAREAMEIEAQIICNLYSEHMLMQCGSADQIFVDQMTGQFNQARFSAAVKLLKSAPLRRFRIKVDDRNLAMPDIEENRQQRTEFLNGVAQYIGSATAAMQAMPGAGKLMGELLMFAIRGFPIAKSEEAQIEEALAQLVGQEMPQEQQDAPAGQQGMTAEEAQIEQSKLQLEAQRMEREFQLKERELALRERELALKEQEMYLQHQNRQREAEAREMKNAADSMVRAAQVDAQRENTHLQNQQRAQDSQIKNFISQRDQEHRHQMDIYGAQRDEERSYVEDEFRSREQDFAEKNAARQAFERKRSAA